MGNIAENIRMIEAEKADAARRSGRNPKDVILCAVTKNHTVEDINEAIAAGVTDIGENRVQELLDKYNEVAPVRWHMIGHLQTNKVKYIIDKVCLIHSVDSFKLAEEIDKRAAQHNITMDILIEVNVAEDEAKFGVNIESTEALLREIADKCENINIRGLMTIAPFEDDPEKVRSYFKNMKKLYDNLSTIDHARINFSYLSMGMSNDRVVAVEEGASIIRVGTAIFGERNYNI